MTSGEELADLDNDSAEATRAIEMEKIEFGRERQANTAATLQALHQRDKAERAAARAQPEPFVARPPPSQPLSPPPPQLHSVVEFPLPHRPRLPLQVAKFERVKPDSLDVQDELKSVDPEALDDVRQQKATSPKPPPDTLPPPVNPAVDNPDGPERGRRMVQRQRRTELDKVPWNARRGRGACDVARVMGVRAAVDGMRELLPGNVCSVEMSTVARGLDMLRQKAGYCKDVSKTGAVKAIGKEVLQCIETSLKGAEHVSLAFRDTLRSATDDFAHMLNTSLLDVGGLGWSVRRRSGGFL